MTPETCCFQKTEIHYTKYDESYKEGEIIRVYQSAIVKQFDPNMYADLIINIEI